MSKKSKIIILCGCILMLFIFSGCTEKKAAEIPQDVVSELPSEVEESPKVGLTEIPVDEKAIVSEDVPEVALSSEVPQTNKESATVEPTTPSTEYVPEEPAPAEEQPIAPAQDKVEDTSSSSSNSRRDEDIYVIARVLAGECYDYNETDKRGVAEVILNRVSNGFGSTVTEVATSPNQFNYYNTQRELSSSDWSVATQVVDNWYANDCQALSGHLYFSAGGGDSNVFRESY